MKKSLSNKVAILLIPVAVFGAAVIVPQPGCKPITQAEINQIEDVVASDLLAGKTKAEIIADITAITATQPGVDVLAILNDVLQLFIHLGKLPPNVLTSAKAMQLQVSGELAARAPVK